MKKFITFFWVALFLLGSITGASAKPETTEGVVTILNVESDKPSFMLKSGGNREKRVEVEKGAKISFKGAEMKLSDLWAGDQVKVDYTLSKDGFYQTKSIEVTEKIERPLAPAAEEGAAIGTSAPEAEAAEAGAEIVKPVVNESEPAKKKGFWEI